LTQLQLRYRVAKRAADLNEAKTVELKKIEESAFAANARGDTGVIFRDLHRGLALLEGRAWTPELDFTTSLLLVPEAVVCDPAKPLAVRLKQLYRAQPASDMKLTARVSIARGGLAPKGKSRVRISRDPRWYARRCCRTGYSENRRIFQSTGKTAPVRTAAKSSLECGRA
jgi:hypothetical protein